MEHIKESPNVHPIITSLCRFHIYFWIRRFIMWPDLLKEYDYEPVKKCIPVKGVWKDGYEKTSENFGDFIKDHKGHIRKVKDVRIRYSKGKGVGAFSGVYRKVGFDYKILKGGEPFSPDDYTRFIPDFSDGLTVMGQELLQESAEAFCYSILGAQAGTRWSIKSGTSKGVQTQKAFRKIVEDMVLQTDETVNISNTRRALIDTTTSILSNMNDAIDETNVVLNLAVSPGMILLPSSLVILDEPIDGYNNILTVAVSGTMKFGVNNGVNYVKSVKQVVKKKTTGDADSVPPHLPTLDTNTEKLPVEDKTTYPLSDKTDVIPKSYTKSEKTSGTPVTPVSGGNLSVFTAAAVVAFLSLRFIVG